MTIHLPSGIAVDETSNNVFLADGSSEGNVLDIFGAEGGAPGGLVSPFQITGLKFDVEPSGLAVDNSVISPAKGTLYVTDVHATPGPGGFSLGKVKEFTRNSGTEKYEQSGELVPGDVDQEGKPRVFGEPLGVAVDSKGNVFVADYASASVIEFSPAGAQLARISTTAAVGNPSSVALNSAGDLFVEGYGSGKVAKYPVNGSGEIESTVFTQVLAAGSGATGIAIDSATNTLYIGLGDRVDQYNAATLAKEGQFGIGTLSASTRIAVNGATERIYVSDSGSGTKNIAVFGPAVTVPGVTTNAASSIRGTKATLNGIVSPDGLAVSECKFEYGLTNAYGSSKPCAEAIPADSSDHAVSAALTGLAPSSVYHFRLMAVNSNGPNFTTDTTFTTNNTAVTGNTSNLTGTHATINATVSPEGLAVSECKFEYGETDSYGSSQSCIGAIPTDEGDHPVNATLSNLLPNGTTYHYRVAIDGEGGPVKGEDRTFATADTVITGNATDVLDTTATLNGTVKLDGVALAECKFEYGPSAAYGSSVPCSPPFGSIPDDGAPHAVSAHLVGLAPNGDYHFRLVAANLNGPILGADRTLSVNGPALITEQEVLGVTTQGASLRARIDPRGFATSYHIEYGTDDSYGSRTPTEFDLLVGSGNGAVKVEVNPSGLQEATTYHYRVVASNDSGTTNGPDQTFTTARANASCSNGKLRTEQTSVSFPGGPTSLPNCMALELASPAMKFNQYAKEGSFSANGERVMFKSLAALADTPRLSFLFNEYVTTRTSSGWFTKPTSLPVRYAVGPPTVCTFTPDLSAWTSSGSTETQSKVGISGVFRQTVEGALTPLSPTLVPVESTGETFSSARCEGGNAAGSQLLFGFGSSRYSPDDPRPVDGSSNLYEASIDDDGTPGIRLVQRDRNGVVYGAGCGAEVGSPSVSKGSVSADGSRILFATRPTAASGSCDTFVNRQRILESNLGQDGAEISEIDSSECTRVAPPCSAINGNDSFKGASLEGGRVFFTSSRQLANSDLDAGLSCGTEVGTSNGCDLYLYDESRPVGSRLTQVSAGDSSDPTPGAGARVLGVSDIAGDGSRVYFAATGVLTTEPNQFGKLAEAGAPNLYCYERDAKFPGGHIAYVATLASEDETAWGGTENARRQAIAVPMLGSDLEDLSVGGDGHVLVFFSRAALTPDDTDGGEPDLYRYDSDTGSMQRISKAAPGGSDNGPFEASPSGDTSGFATGQAERNSIGGFGTAPGLAIRARKVSEDGNTIVFVAAEPLSPEDTDGVESVYVWRDGDLRVIPNARVPGVSMSGDEVLFQTSEQLVPEDGDGATDVYVARMNGGYPIPVPPVPCTGETCQEPFRAQPGATGAASDSFVGPGNERSSSQTKSKKKSKSDKKKKKKAKKHKNKRAGREQGGQK